MNLTFSINQKKYLTCFCSKFSADLAAVATDSCSFVPNRLPWHQNKCVKACSIGGDQARDLPGP